MHKICKAFLALAAFSALVFSCAKYETEDNLVAQQRIREAWMRVNLGRVLDANENGLYVIEEKKGSSKEMGDTAFVLLDYVAKDLDGNYNDYTTEEAARIMSTYKATNYYSPEVVQLGKYKLYTPVENYIRSLGEGGSATFLLPPEATTYDYTAELKKYYKSYGNDGTKPDKSENYLYDIKVVKVIEDIYKYQIEQLEDFANKNYAGVDSICEGFYMVKLKESEAKDTITAATSVKVNYIGKLLDGFCFDTNIQDSAKVYGLYEYGKTYSPLSVTWQKDGYTLSDSGSKTYVSDVINGFAMTVGRMKYGEKAISFFWSKYAYGTSSTDTYPAYSPMCFYVEIPPKE